MDRQATLSNDGGTTSPTLLGRAADWGDVAAWREMFARYDPLLRRWCAGCGLEAWASEEVCQRVWVELVERLRTFRYDPRRTFRGWLRELCRSRSIDLLRQLKREGRTRRLFDEDGNGRWGAGYDSAAAPDDADTDPDPRHTAMRQQAELAQAAVRARVDARTWEAYWQIAIQDRSVRETASALGMSYAAAFAAYTRVQRRLRAEGQRRLPALLKS